MTESSLPQTSPESQAHSGIIRVHKENNFAIVPNALLQDERLSAAATGCIAYLLSKPNDWQLRRVDIERRFDCGKEKAQKMLRELEDAGYLVRETTRDEQGRFKYVSVIYEKPQQITRDGFSGAGKASPLLRTDPTKNRETTKLQLVSSSFHCAVVQEEEGTGETMKSITARYEGKCSLCSRSIKQGDSIHVLGPRKSVHIDCQEKAEQDQITKQAQLDQLLEDPDFVAFKTRFRGWQCYLAAKRFALNHGIEETRADFMAQPYMRHSQEMFIQLFELFQTYPLGSTLPTPVDITLATIRKAA
jgi:hypothetical protein